MVKNRNNIIKIFICICIVFINFFIRFTEKQQNLNKKSCICIVDGIKLKGGYNMLYLIEEY